MSLGSLITKARLDAGFTVDDLSGVTSIRATLLREIEADDFSHCGGETYSRGHLRNIAAKLDVDPQIFINAFETEQSQSMRSISELLLENSIMKKQEEPRKVSWKVLAAISVSSLFVVGVVQVIFSNSSIETPLPIASQSNSISPTPLPTAELSPTAEPTVSPRVGVELIVSATRAKSWLFVSDAAGQTLFSAVISKGTSQTFTSDVLLNLRVGNAGGVDLTVNGKMVEAIGANGQVVSVSYGVDS